MEPNSLQDNNAERLLSGQAWEEFCDRLKAVGKNILHDDFPGSSRERTEGFRHLARVVVQGLQWSLEHSDPEFPQFYRILDDVTMWAGQNADNTYLRAKLRGDSTYLLSGNIGNLHELCISTHNGDMHLEKYKVGGDLDSSQLKINSDGNFEIILSPEEHPENWIPLQPDVDHVTIRAFYYNWDSHRPGEFHIVKVGNEGKVPVPLEPAVLAAKLDEAGEWIGKNITYWNNYLTRFVGQTEVNKVSSPRSEAGGSSNIFYGVIPFDLEEDEALIIETLPPEARYWNLQCYTYGWFETEAYTTLGSLNGHQAHIDSDGLVRIVVSHEDPGAPNWLDTRGRNRGIVIYRWAWSKNAPTPKSQVAKFIEISKHLPTDTPNVEKISRREQILRRRIHIERRFHQ